MVLELARLCQRCKKRIKVLLPQHHQLHALGRRESRRLQRGFVKDGIEDMQLNLNEARKRLTGAHMMEQRQLCEVAAVGIDLKYIVVEYN